MKEPSDFGRIPEPQGAPEEAYDKAHHLVDLYAELFALSYQTGKSIHISPPPRSSWHVTVSEEVFKSTELVDALQAAIKYLAAELEHQKDTQ